MMRLRNTSKTYAMEPEEACKAVLVGRYTWFCILVVAEICTGTGILLKISTPRETETKPKEPSIQLCMFWYTLTFAKKTIYGEFFYNVICLENLVWRQRVWFACGIPCQKGKKSFIIANLFFYAAFGAAV
jgi:hypothetical protein